MVHFRFTLAIILGSVSSFPINDEQGSAAADTFTNNGPTSTVQDSVSGRRLSDYSVSGEVYDEGERSDPSTRRRPRVGGHFNSHIPYERQPPQTNVDQEPQ